MHVNVRIVLAPNVNLCVFLTILQSSALGLELRACVNIIHTARPKSVMAVISLHVVYLHGVSIEVKPVLVKNQRFDPTCELVSRILDLAELL